MLPILAAGLQVVLALPVPDVPVRFGVPLPAAAIARGLRLRGPGQLQWRRLPVGGEHADPVWIEVGLDGVQGVARIVAGGAGPTPAGVGPVFVRTRSERQTAAGREVVTRWSFDGGVIDERERVEFDAPITLDGGDYGVGEARTRWRCDGAAAIAPERAAVVCELPPQVWQAAGILPPAGRLGREVRRQLLTVQRALVELPGERGAGDFARGGGAVTTVTNGEFDTALGMLQLALATGDRTAFGRGLRCAAHLRDRDLDRRTGLPFPHGKEHRTGVPESGHAWLRGLLLAGLLSADDDLIAAARSIGHALAARPPVGRGRNERARDYAWPLFELEALLAIDPDPALAAAADRLAQAIDGRFDASVRTFRFGEGEVGAGYLERAWITGGVVLPALRLHLRRRPQPVLAEHVRQVEQALLEQLDTARAGVPTHWRHDGHRVFAEHRVENDVRALFLLEGLPPADLQRLLRRAELRDIVRGLPELGDPDLATSFSLVARCAWIYR